ncbi:MAG: hypothetical protein IPK82_37385 [Polyangiaceae bacterium]|nr:hypothetical protein [Polyangiaceae bacterium]
MRHSSLVLALLPSAALLVTVGGCGLIFNYDGYQEASGTGGGGEAGTSSIATSTGGTGGAPTSGSSVTATTGGGGAGGGLNGFLETPLWLRQMNGNGAQAINDLKVYGPDVWVAGAYYQGFQFHSTLVPPPEVGVSYPFAAQLDFSGDLTWYYADLPTGWPSGEAAFLTIAPFVGSSFYAGGYSDVMGTITGYLVRSESQTPPLVVGTAKSVVASTGNHQIVDVELSDSSTPVLVASASDGSIAFNSVPAGSGADPDIGFVTCLDESCNMASVELLGGTGVDSVRAIAPMLDGQVITGSYHQPWEGSSLPTPPPSGATDTPFVVAQKPMGGWEAGFVRSSVSNEVCSAMIDLGTSTGTDVTVDTDGNVIAVGSACYAMVFEPGQEALPVGGRTDTFVAKLDADGNLLWARMFGDSEIQIPTSVATDPVTKHIFVAGFFSGNIDFGSGVTLSGGTAGIKIFVVELDAAGEALGARAFGDGSEPIERRLIRIALAESHLFLSGSWRTAIDFGKGVVLDAPVDGSLDGFVMAFER